jgi:hypothetical protein
VTSGHESHGVVPTVALGCHHGVIDRFSHPECLATYDDASLMLAYECGLVQVRCAAPLCPSGLGTKLN